MTKKNRLQSLDFIRGVAVLSMIIYHFLFDLNYFSKYSVDLSILPIAILGVIVRLTFVGLVGISLFFSFSNNDLASFKEKAVRKALQILLIAFGVSFLSYLAFPDSLIRFGVLHLIGLSLILAIPFVSKPKISLVLGLIISTSGIVFFPIETSIDHLWWLGFIKQPFTDLDYFPLIPWFGVVLLGIWIGHNWLEQIEPTAKKIINRIPEIMLQPFIFFGKNALIIYLTHQLILIPLVLLLNSIF